MKQYILPLLLSMVSFSSGNTQTLYAISSSGDLIRLFDTQCISEEMIASTDMSSPPGTFDIAYEQGILYTINICGLSTINPLNGDVNWIDPSWPFNVCGLGGDENGNLYVSGNDVYRYNILNETIDSLGSLYPYATAGDLEYVNGNLYISATDPNEGNVLLKVGLNPFSYSVVGSLPTEFFGLSKSLNLDQQHLYATSNSIPLKLYIVDITDASTNLICSDISTEQLIWGLTSTRDKLSADENTIDNIRISQDMDNQTLSIQLMDNVRLHYGIYDELGKMIINSNLTDELTTINTSSFSSGIYHIRFTNSYGIQVHQIRIVCI